MMNEFGQPESSQPQPSSSHLMAHHASVSSRASRRESKLESKRHSMSGNSTHSRHRLSVSGGPIDSITGLMRRMSSTGGNASPPGSASYHTTNHGLNMPTPGLISAMAGAAHFSSGTTDIPAHQKFRPTFADGEDRTKLDPVRQAILDDTLQLFCARPTLEIFERHWRMDAVFENPLGKCKGYKEYTAQWFGLAKMVSDSKTTSHRVLASTSSPSRIVYSQTQEYTFRLTKKKKVVQSMVVIHLDNEDKIVMLEDKWKGDDQPSNLASRFFRRLNAKTMSVLIRVPKPPPGGLRATSQATEGSSSGSYPPTRFGASPSP